MEIETDIEISIVSPAYNEEAGLSTFVEAVSAHLNQVSRSWEIVFVDDGSRRGRRIHWSYLH